MAARTGQFRRSIRQNLGAGKVGQAERCVQDVKAQGRKVNPFAVCTASLKGTTRHRGRSVGGR